jgi:hypothetical protein
MLRTTLEAQNGSGGSRDAKHHQYASDEIHCFTSVGLTRIELVTSSLSGMRSNQLSYSPELFSGHMSLLPLSVTLNRGYQNLFFQY